MTFRITEVVDWELDEYEMAGDSGHMSGIDIKRRVIEEYEEKVEKGEWPGLPFTCEANNEEEAIEKYNQECCVYDYYKATEVEFADPTEGDPITLQQLLCASDANTLFRVKDSMDDEKAVGLVNDFLAGDKGVLDVLNPYLYRDVAKFTVGVSEDPLSPNENLPTIWIEVK